MTNPGWTPERLARLRELSVQGYSASAIAADLGGVTRNAVVGIWARNKDIPRPPAEKVMKKAKAESAPRVAPKEAPKPAGFALRPSFGGAVPPQLPMPAEPSRGGLSCEPVTIDGLTARTCRWPLWAHADHPTREAAMYCGAPVTWSDNGPSSYCREHHAVAWQVYKPRTSNVDLAA
jgi:GcrA cell cycle regulator